MGQINTNNYPTVESLADTDLLIVENSTNGTGTTTPKQLREHAIGTDPLQTTSQTVTGAINELKREIDEGGGSAVIGNPSDTASSILDKIKIGSRTYDASAIKPYTATNITTSAISISIGLAEDSALNGRIIAVNTGSRSGTPSNAWGLNILYNDGGSSVGCAILKSDGTAFTDAVTANEVLFLSMDMTNLEATIVDIAGASGGGGGDLYAGLGVGKMVSFTNNVMDTDIDLHRAPMAGDRLLIWFDTTVQSPTGLTTYNNGTAVTSNLENVIPLYYNAGWNLVEYMNDGLLYNNVWVRKQNVPIPNNTLFGLSDTAITSPTDGQVLTFNSVTGKWENQDPSGGDTPAIPVLNKESVYSQNNVSSLSATFKAKSKSAYMVVACVACDGSKLPTIENCSVSINEQSYAGIYSYYHTTGYGMDSKYAVLDLNEGDDIEVSMSSNVSDYGTSCLIALIKLSQKIKDLSVVDAAFSDMSAPEVIHNAESNGFYLLFFFDRHAGIGAFDKLKLNDATITQNIVICADEDEEWQVSHGLCLINAKAADNIKVKSDQNGIFEACGIMSLKKA